MDFKKAKKKIMVGVIAGALALSAFATIAWADYTNPSGMEYSSSQHVAEERVVLFEASKTECISASAEADLEAMARSGVVGGQEFNNVSGDKNIGATGVGCVEISVKITANGSATIN